MHLASLFLREAFLLVFSLKICLSHFFFIKWFVHWFIYLHSVHRNRRKKKRLLEEYYKDSWLSFSAKHACFCILHCINIIIPFSVWVLFSRKDRFSFVWYRLVLNSFSYFYYSGPASAIWNSQEPPNALGLRQHC